MRFLLGSLALLGLGCAAFAQAPTIDRDGTELLRGLLNFHGVRSINNGKALSELDEGKVILLAIDSGDSVGDFTDLPRLSQQILSQGGAVLLATRTIRDYSNYFAKKTSIRITGQVVAENSGNVVTVVGGVPSEFERFMMRNMSVLPDGGWSLFGGTSSIQALEPSTIVVGASSEYIRNGFAGFPQNATFRRTGASVTNTHLLAVGATGSKVPFRSLILADSNLLRNRLMLEAKPDGQPQNENLAFANRLAIWLKGNGTNTATHCLFIENGVVRTNFDTVSFEAPSLDIPPISPEQLPSPTDRNLQRKVTEAVNKRLQDWQESGGPTRNLLGNLQDDTNFRRIMQGFAVALGIGLLVRILMNLWSQRHQPNLGAVPRDAGKLIGRSPAGSVDRQAEELLQLGNHEPVLRDYLRELFNEAGFPRLTDSECISVKACKLSGADAKTLTNSVHILWEVAYGSKQSPIPYSRWKELEPMIETVRAAVAAGTLRLQPVGGAS